MTMTTTKTIAPKAQKALDAAAANGWTSEIVENSENYTTITITHPSPQKWSLGEIKLAFYAPEEGKWNFDYGQTRAANDDGSLSYGTTKITLRDAMSVIEGSYSPRAQAAKALDEMALANRREARMAAYAAEPDSPERRLLRNNLIATRDATFSQDKLAAETAEHGLEWATGRFLEDSLVEIQMGRLAGRVLEWEGKAYQDEGVTSLEEATVKVADSALVAVLGNATRGTSGSTSLFVNVWKDVEAVAQANFVKRFHPLYGGYSAKRMIENVNPKWMGHNGF